MDVVGIHGYVHGEDWRNVELSYKTNLISRTAKFVAEIQTRSVRPAMSRQLSYPSSSYRTSQTTIRSPISVE